MRASCLRKCFLAGVLAASGVFCSCAAEWGNLDDEHYAGGRRCSAGYLTGKVVLVCQDVTQSARMEEIWSSFKTKPFVLLGSYAKAPKGVSYPVYREVSVDGKKPESPLCIVDAMGKLRYRGADERRATELAVTFLTDMESPKTETQWCQFLDYEFANMPGHAYIRYLDFKKKHPARAKEYADRFSEIAKTPDVKKLAELVRFSKSVKDLRAIDPKKARMVKSRLKGKIDDAVSKYASLKESENPLVVQEAKNALADLAWAKAALL